MNFETVTGDGTLNWPLRRALLKEYGAADKRRKNVEKMKVFRVYDFELAVGADKQPLSYVCMIFAESTAQTVFERDRSLVVSLVGNVPDSRLVDEWVAETGGRTTANLGRERGFSS